MIKTFKDFVDNYSYEDSIYEFIDNMESDEVESLKKEIDKFGEKQIDACLIVFSYISIEPSNELIKQVLKSRLDLAYEAYRGGINDTCQRELLIDAFLREIGIDMHWPCNGDPEDQRRKFAKLFFAKCEELGIKTLD